MSQIWDSIKGFIAGGLDVMHTGAEPIFGDAAWGWAIIGLTVIVRIILIPLAVKQFKSMRAMQELQPQIKAVQKKYKADRSMMRSDPERYRKIQSTKNEKLQALYKEHDVNPVAGCLPLLAQGPIFFALYSVLRDPNTLDGQLSNASFYGLRHLGDTVSAMGTGGWMTYFQSPAIWGTLLIVAVAASMFVSQKQMQGRNQTTQGDAQATQQKVMLYAMPAMMGFFGFQLPLGVLLYWVTTNVWTMVQQSFIMREAAEGAAGSSSGGGAGGKGDGGGGPGGKGDGADGSGSRSGTAGNVRRPAGSDNGDSPSSDGTGSRPAPRKADKHTQKADKHTKPVKAKGAGDKPKNDKRDKRDKRAKRTTARRSGSSGHLPSRPSRRT